MEQLQRVGKWAALGMAAVVVLPALVLVLIFAAYIALTVYVLRETKLGDVVDRLTSGEM